MKTIVITFILYLVLSPSSIAANYKWVESKGSAEIVRGDIISAKNRAFRDALKNASQQVGVKLTSSETVKNSALSSNNLSIRSSAKILDTQIIEESQSATLYQIELRAKVMNNEFCATHIANPFSKSVAVTSFELIDPQQTSLGHLGMVDRLLATHVATRLNQLNNINAIDANFIKLNSIKHAAPTSVTKQAQLSLAIETAKGLGSQYVISGIVKELAMPNQDAPYSQSWDNLLSKIKINKQKRNRHFIFDLFIHDGYSGALLFKKTYHSQGIWSAKHHAKIGFLTPAFNKIDYGKNVNNLLDLAVSDVRNLLVCQPYVAKINNTNNNNIYLSAGAQSGLRPGDTVSVYRTKQVFDRNQVSQWQLTDTKVVAVIRQVQPHLAIAELPMDARMLNVQTDDVVFAW